MDAAQFSHLVEASESHRHGDLLTEEEIATWQSHMRPDACCKCKYWEEYDAPELEEVDAECPLLVRWWEGQCHRNTPIPVTVEKQREVNLNKGLWPETKADAWCGEWKAKESAQ